MAMNLKKGLLLDVFDCYGYDLTTGKLIFVNENLTSASIKGSGDEQEVRNGKGNSLFATLSSNKGIEVTINSNVFSFDALAFMAGTTVHTGTGTSYYPTQYLTLTSGKLTLAKAPKDTTKVQIFKDGLEITGATITGTQVTITGGVEGATYAVMPYGYASSANAQEVVIKSEEFPAAIKMVLIGVVRDANSKVTDSVSFTFDRIKPKMDFNVETSSDLSAKETSIVLQALATNGALATIVTEPIA